MNKSANQGSQATDLDSSSNELAGRRLLIIVENLPVPFDRRVWQEARTLADAGAQVAIICPTGKNFTERYQCIQGVHIYRHPLPIEASGVLGFIWEYTSALYWETVLAWKIFFKHGFDTIQGCNPPDLIFCVAWQFKLLGKRYIFDHHDINPELYEAKFNKRGLLWQGLRALEWLTFKTADVVISTNESYRHIAIGRGGKSPEDVFVVRSGPDLDRVRPVAPNMHIRKGRDYLIGYVGVMGDQEGIDLLLSTVRYIVKELGREDIQFALIGGGPSLTRLKELAINLGLTDYVDFYGRVDDDLLLEVLSTSDVCVNPDRVNQMNDKSTMNKILEYMALGKPIVQFDVTEGRHSADIAALYAKANDPVDFACKIIELIEDKQLRDRMGQFGRLRIENEMAWNHEVPKLIAAYKRSVRPHRILTHVSTLFKHLRQQ